MPQVKPIVQGIELKLQIFLIPEGDYVNAFCPALELSSFGKDEKDALEGFEEALKIFVEETQKKGTLERVLLDLGWRLVKFPAPDYQPPLQDFISSKHPDISFGRSIEHRVHVY